MLEAAAAGVKGVPKVFDWEDVKIKNRYDTTDNIRGVFPNIPDHTHRRIALEGIAVPIWEFTDLFELISVLIDHVECKL